MILAPGVQVKCVKRGPWRMALTSEIDDTGPRFGEICTVTDMCDAVFCDDTYLILQGYEDEYNANQFRPIEPDISELQAILTKIKEPENV